MSAFIWLMQPVANVIQTETATSLAKGLGRNPTNNPNVTITNPSSIDGLVVPFYVSELRQPLSSTIA